ncbi:hypothetical protein MEC_01168 [Bartonella alsatica IBS 382]|uniref:Fumarate lyase N-terminal domain-containing protein n=1 Tax=Bartonella alsatica IBS 382 TaxID=1094551 RepID=J0PWS2_9HYPH|nr:hypothetical protein MEC_01168 [Bartonella alsatica IBS 382]
MSELIGSVVRCLHTVHLHNNQIAVDLHLWVCKATQSITHALKGMKEQLLIRAEQHVDTFILEFMYSQTAQLVTFCHYMMAYIEILGRDLLQMHDVIE